MSLGGLLHSEDGNGIYPAGRFVDGFDIVPSFNGDTLPTPSGSAGTGVHPDDAIWQSVQNDLTLIDIASTSSATSPVLSGNAVSSTSSASSSSLASSVDQTHQRHKKKQKHHGSSAPVPRLRSNGSSSKEPGLGGFVPPSFHLSSSLSTCPNSLPTASSSSSSSHLPLGAMPMLPPPSHYTTSQPLLIDLSAPPPWKQRQENYSPDSTSVMILHGSMTIVGYHFDKKSRKLVEAVTLVRGTLFKPLTELDSSVVTALRLLCNRPETDILVRDMIRHDIYAVVRSTDVMRLSDTQTMILLPVPPADRYSLHRDIERFHFIESLRIDDFVQLEIEEPEGVIMYPGQVVWMGTRPKELGTWYQINIPPYEMDGSGPDWSQPGRLMYSNAAHLHKPMATPVASYNYSSGSRHPTPKARTIPIKRVETVFDVEPSPKQQPTAHSRNPPPSSSSSNSIPAPLITATSNQHSTSTTGANPREVFVRDLSSWDGDPRTVSDPTREWQQQPKTENRERKYEQRGDGRYRGEPARRHGNHSLAQQPEPHQQPYQQPQQPPPRSRTSSMGNGTHSMPTRSQSAHVVAAYDKTFSVDDPILSNGARVGDRCEWNDGKSSHRGIIRFLGHLKGHTNLYAGIEFDDAVGKGTGVYQGEVVFQTAENRAGFVVISSLKVLPSSNGHQSHKSMRQKQASAESLSDPPSSQASAPPMVPPRPVMRPEDYLIEPFSEGDYVEVCHLGACRSGVVRWLGDAVSEVNDRLEQSAVVELDDDVPSSWRPAPSSSTTSMDVPRGVLVPKSSLRRDRRVNGTAHFDNDDYYNNRNFGRQDFGSIDSGVETAPCEPWKSTDDLIGRMKGIQGHRNSCYLDATLYAMFVQSTVFDDLLTRSPRKGDKPEHVELVRLLATEIVFPLRKFHYVRADHIMKVRELLAQILPHMKGLTSEEKDPEEILLELFGNILKATPFLELINLKDNKLDRMFICPLIVEDWQGGVATTQHLLERSIRAAGVMFATPPKTLIVQLPRYGQQKVFDKILPLERIDITGLVENATVPCYSCGKPANGMCPECFLCKRVFLSEVSYCHLCFTKSHLTSGESDHAIRQFYPSAKPHKRPTSHKMTLSAVLCIETSHYVAFVRSSTGRWLFFDSMADREGLSDGYNVPQVKECDRMSWWLSPQGWDRLRAADESGSTKMMLGKGSDVDPLVTRLLSDSYICFYNEEGPSTSSSSGSLGGNLITSVIQKMKM